MSEHYIDPADEANPTKLPNLSIMHRAGEDLDDDDYLGAEPLTYRDVRHLAEVWAERRRCAVLPSEDPDHDTGDGDEDVMCSCGYVGLALDGDVTRNGCRVLTLDADTDYAKEGAGFYFACCFPGCMPDSDWTGPYPTEEEALEEARDLYGEE